MKKYKPIFWKTGHLQKRGMSIWEMLLYAEVWIALMALLIYLIK